MICSPLFLTCNRYHLVFALTARLNHTIVTAYEKGDNMPAGSKVRAMLYLLGNR